MKISFLYIYSQHSSNQKNLLDSINYVIQSPKLQIIIINDEPSLSKSFEKLKSLYKGVAGIRFASYPKVSFSFLYNRGISLAIGDFVGIIASNIKLNDSYISVLNKNFSKNKDTFLFIDKNFINGLKKNNFILSFYDKPLFENLNLLKAPFYLSKKIVDKYGVYFDENIERVEVLDLVQRSFKFCLKVETINQKSSSKFQIKEAFSTGYNLFSVFDKNNHGLLLLTKVVLGGFFINSLIVFLILLGMFYGRFYKIVVLRIFKLTRRINRALIEFCRKYKFINLLLYPVELMVEPTNICDASCPLCPTGSKQLKRHKGFLTFELFKKIVDDGKFFLERILLWNLGEPFLNKDIYSIIQYAKKHGIELMSSSNGYAIKDLGSVNRLLESGIDRLIVGVDGVDQETFTLYRKGLNYEKVLRGLELVQKQKKDLNIHYPIIEFQMILMRQNSHQLDEAYALSQKLETEFRLKYVNLNMVSDEEKQKYLPKDTKSHIYNLINKKSFFKEKKNNLPCVIWDGMVINWNGEVNPCIFDYYASIKLGNIADTSLIKVWRSEMFKKLRKSVITHKASVKLCRNCPINERYSELYIL